MCEFIACIVELRIHSWQFIESGLKSRWILASKWMQVLLFVDFCLRELQTIVSLYASFNKRIAGIWQKNMFQVNIITARFTCVLKFIKHCLGSSVDYPLSWMYCYYLTDFRIRQYCISILILSRSKIYFYFVCLFIKLKNYKNRF